MLQDAISKVEGLYVRFGSMTLERLISQEKDVVAKAKLLVDLFGKLNETRMARCLNSGALTPFLKPYLDHQAKIQSLFAACADQLDRESKKDAKVNSLLAREAEFNKVPLKLQICASLKQYVIVNPAPLARFKVLQLDKIMVSDTYESRFGMAFFYQERLRSKLANVGFLYSLMQESVPYPVSKARIKVLECEVETWLPGAAVGDKNWIEIVQEWGSSGRNQHAAAAAFFRFLCLSHLVHPDLPNGTRQETLTFDRGGITLAKEETLQPFVQRATIRDVYDRILKFPAIPANINSRFVIHHAPLCEDILQQELVSRCICHIIKDYETIARDSKEIAAKSQENLHTNRESLEAIYEEAFDTPQYAFLLTALLVAHLRALATFEIRNAEELFEQIYGMAPAKREELYHLCAAQLYRKRFILLSEGFTNLIARYGFSNEQRPFILLHCLYMKHELSLVKEEEMADFVALNNFINRLESRTGMPLSAQRAFLLLNGQFISRQFTNLYEDILGFQNFILQFHRTKPLLPMAFLNQVRTCQANLIAEGARLKTTLKLGPQEHECLDWLVAAAKWMSMHPDSHELINRLLYLLPLPAASFPEERKRAMAENGKLIELLPGFRAIWTQGQCCEEGFELHMRFVDSKSSMQTFALDELLNIPKGVLEKEGELVDLIIRLSAYICNDWLPSDDKQIDPKTPCEALQHLKGCEDLKLRLKNYMSRGDKVREYGLEAVRFLTELKIKWRFALCHSWIDYPREDLATVAARGNVYASQGGLSLVPSSLFQPGMIVRFNEMEPFLRTLMEGKDVIKMPIHVPSRQVRTQCVNSPVDIQILNRTAEEAEMRLSFHEEPKHSVTAKLNLTDTDEERLRYFTWLTLMLKAKWFAKIIPKQT
ncbi:MAG: hypothetical protein LLG04_02750 [Parachlamydia sp.]|nr:hypothetical protein [Parachlamydia sp.]